LRWIYLNDSKEESTTNKRQQTSSEEMINLADIRDSKEKFDNRYRLIDKIGGGGFSEVWLAHDNNAGIDVALKIYTPNGELDEEGKDDFKREFACLCGLNHSNIIHAIGFGIHKGDCLIWR
jgi:serine/threonine protein kinase